MSVCYLFFSTDSPLNPLQLDGSFRKVWWWWKYNKYWRRHLVHMYIQHFTMLFCVTTLLIEGTAQSRERWCVFLLFSAPPLPHCLQWRRFIFWHAHWSEIMVITVLSLHGNIYVVEQTCKTIFLSSQYHKIYHAVCYLIQPCSWFLVINLDLWSEFCNITMHLLPAVLKKLLFIPKTWHIIYSWKPAYNSGQMWKKCGSRQFHSNYVISVDVQLLFKYTHWQYRE